MKKFLTFVLAVTIILSVFSTLLLSASVIDSNNTSKYVETFLNIPQEEFSALTENSSAYDVIITIQFSYPYINFASLSTMEKEDRLAAVEEYHVPRNQGIVQELNIPNCTIATFGPFGEISCDSLEQYYTLKPQLQAISESDQIITVNVSIYAPTYFDATEGEEEDKTPPYPWEQIKTDIGWGNSTYDGTGIKVGVMEPGVPKSSRVTFGKYHTDAPDSYQYIEGLYQDEHATYVLSIIGGHFGLAPGVDLYHTVATSPVAALNYFTENAVDVANISQAWSYSRQYDNYAARTDYFIYATGIAIVVSAGNIHSWITVISPAQSNNVISVGATNVNKAVASFSCSTTQTLELYKPDLVAPGEQILIQSSLDFVPDKKDGTSYSAPIVTAVVAKLMHEFPKLKGDPALLKAVLTRGCVMLPTQNYELDDRAGAGLVNYANSRQVMVNRDYYDDDKSGEWEGSPVLNFDVTINAGSKFLMRYAFTIPGAPVAMNENACTLAVSTYRITLIDAQTYETVKSMVVPGTTGYFTYTNSSSSNKTYIVEFTLVTDGVNSMDEYIGIAY